MTLNFHKKNPQLDSRTKRIFMFLFSIFFALIFCFTGNLSAQEGAYPSESYYYGVNHLYKGDPQNAKIYYENELKNSLRIGASRWIDSICYYTMLGESLYMLGNLAEALNCYNSALNLHVQYSAWTARTNFQAMGITTRPCFSAPWGAGSRNVPLRTFSPKAIMTVGDLLSKERIMQGGALNTPKIIKLDAMELLRCLTLCLKRRIDILGPLCEFDEMSTTIFETFRVRAITPNHWAVVFYDVMYGLALEGIGKKRDAVDVFNQVLKLPYDHPLSPVVFYETGRINAENGKLREAIPCFYNASVAAYQFSDPLMQEESLRMYSNLKKTLEPHKIDSIFNRAWETYKTNGNKTSYIFASLSEEMIESLLQNGNIKDASSFLRSVEHFIILNKLKDTSLGDRWYYLQALANYIQLRTEEGDQAILHMMAGRQIRSPRIYQLGLLNAISQSGKISSAGPINLRSVTDLYGNLLRHPNDSDWALNPIDSLVFEMFIPSEAYEQWFILLGKRELKDKALEASEEARAKRFLARQILGSRLASLRYLLEAPENQLPKDVRLNKQNIFIDYPDIQKLAKSAEDLKSKIRKLPIFCTDEQEKKEQKKLLEELKAVSLRQEAQLRLTAASRLTIPSVFPPLHPLENIRANMNPNTSFLVFFNAGREVFGFMITSKDIDFWHIGPENQVRANIASFLKKLGCSEGNRAIQYNDLIDNTWKSEGSKLLAFLLGDPHSGGARFSTVFKELVIVPDGVLWYLPFEALPVLSSTKNEPDKVTPLIFQPDLTIRYAPTVNLGMPNTVGQPLMAETALVPGRFFLKESEKFSNRELERLTTTIPKTTVLKTSSIPTSASVFVPRLDRLINLNEINGTQQANWVPLQTASENLFNQVFHWGTLPWGAPRLMIYPGFRSSAENSLKSDKNGNEFFYPIMQMLSTGAETVLISRWRIGGKTTYDLLNSFMKNQEKLPFAQAWKQALKDLQQTDFEPANELRLGKAGVKQVLPKVVHPFFWSNYLLIDSGEPVKNKIETATTGAASVQGNANAPGNAQGNMPNNAMQGNAPNPPANAPNIANSSPNASKDKKKIKKSSRTKSQKKKEEASKTGTSDATAPGDKKTAPAPGIPSNNAAAPQTEGPKTNPDPTASPAVPKTPAPPSSDSNSPPAEAEEKAPGVVPVITVNDPAKTSDKTPAKEGKGTDHKEKSNAEANNTEKKDNSAAPKPNSAKDPVTDKQLQKEDEEAEDFYKDN